MTRREAAGAHFFAVQHVRQKASNHQDASSEATSEHRITAMRAMNVEANFRVENGEIVALFLQPN